MKKQHPNQLDEGRIIFINKQYIYIYMRRTGFEPVMGNPTDLQSAALTTQPPSQTNIKIGALGLEPRTLGLKGHRSTN